MDGQRATGVHEPLGMSRNRTGGVDQSGGLTDNSANGKDDGRGDPRHGCRKGFICSMQTGMTAGLCFSYPKMNRMKSESGNIH